MLNHLPLRPKFQYHLDISSTAPPVNHHCSVPVRVYPYDPSVPVESSLSHQQRELESNHSHTELSYSRIPVVLHPFVLMPLEFPPLLSFVVAVVSLRGWLFV